MVDHLQNNDINLIVTENLEHNHYDERTDLQQPIFEFYDALYPLDTVCDVNFLRSTIIDMHE